MSISRKSVDDVFLRTFSLERAIRAFVAAAGLVVAMAGLASILEELAHWSLWFSFLFDLIGKNTELLSLVVGFITGVASGLIGTRRNYIKKRDVR